MAFDEVRFPDRIAYGATGGPERRTEIVTLASGFESRNTAWADSRRRYDAGYGMRSLNDIHAILAFFEARSGRLRGFRWKDHADWKSCPPQDAITPQDQTIGTGDGATTQFQLVKTYASGGHSYERKITKPVIGTVHIAVAGSELAEGAGFTVNTIAGVVTLAVPPDAGQSVTAGFEFDVPVRFDSDSLVISLPRFNAGDIPSIPIVEIRL